MIDKKLGMNHGRFVGLLNSCPSGPRIEFGVFRGDTLKIIADHDSETIGVDSFQGMAEHGPRDVVDGKCQYPRGRLSAPLDSVRAAVGQAVILIQGFVPDVLSRVPDGPYSFAHIDMDQYQPTRDALEWIFARMVPGGIVCCDDWFAGRDYLAAGAINEVARSRPLSGTSGRKAWWIVEQNG